MDVKIMVKGFSNKESKITNVIYKYPEINFTLRSFLEETVRITVEEYERKAENSDKLEGLGQIGIEFANRQKNIDLGKAINTVIQNFRDGLVAVFIDGKQYEDCLEEKINLHEMSEVTFIRLTFLVGRMW